GIEFLLVGAERVPRRDFFGPGSKFRAGGHHAQVRLTRQCLFADFIPTLVELAFKLRDPFFGCMMRCVTEARGIISEERFIRRQRFLLPNPCDCMVCQVGVKVILWVIRRFDRLGSVEQGRMPLVGVSANEAIEVLESESGRPEIEWPSLTRLPIGDIVVLAIPGCVPAVLFEDFRNCAAALWHY